MLDFMSDVVTLSRPERLGSFVVRLVTDADVNAMGTAEGQRSRRELHSKILTHFAEAIRGLNGIRLKVKGGGDLVMSLWALQCRIGC